MARVPAEAVRLILENAGDRRVVLGPVMREREDLPWEFNAFALSGGRLWLTTIRGDGDCDLAEVKDVRMALATELAGTGRGLALVVVDSPSRAMGWCVDAWGDACPAEWRT